LLVSIKNILIPGADNKPIAMDLFFKEDATNLPVVIYAHGFNGFKDWGNFDLIAQQFAAAGFVLLKFNFSHNGTTPAQPQDFTDLEAFGNNNYSKQLKDLEMVTNWVCNPSNIYRDKTDVKAIYLVGHSMGGGISILHAAKDKRIKKLITWASISQCKTPWGSWSPDKITEWKKNGVQYYTNSRTGQQLPLYYQLYEDYDKHAAQLNIQAAATSVQIPVLICHGTKDVAVPVEEASNLKSWFQNAQLYIVESDHVFGRSHPWMQTVLPAPMQAVLEKSIAFLKEPIH
jgi:uncharacterized protein